MNQMTRCPTRFRGLRWTVVLIALLGSALRLKGEPASPSSVIVDLRDIPQFSELFNKNAGHPRLVLLLSPT